MTVATITTKEKLIKSPVRKKRIVHKRNKLNEVGFVQYNKNDYQVFLYICTLIKNVEHGVKLKPEQIQREYVIHAKDIAEAFSIEVNHAYQMLKKAGYRLVRTALTLQHPDLFMTEEIALCKRSKYHEKTGTLVVEFNEYIMPYFENVANKITQYQLKNVSQFDSIYSIRLYELIQQFTKNQEENTGWISKSLEEWRRIFATGTKYKLYADFKRKTFEHAVNEINLYYPTLKLKYTELTEGKKVVAIKFQFIKTEIISTGQSIYGNKVNVYRTHKQRTAVEIEQERLAEFEKVEEALLHHIPLENNTVIHDADYDALYALNQEVEQHPFNEDTDYDTLQKEVTAHLEQSTEEQNIEPPINAEYEALYALNQKVEQYVEETKKTTHKSFKDLVKQLKEKELLERQQELDL